MKILESLISSENHKKYDIKTTQVNKIQNVINFRTLTQFILKAVKHPILKGNSNSSRIHRTKENFAKINQSSFRAGLTNIYQNIYPKSL